MNPPVTLVTGASGRIGHRIIANRLAAGDTVVASALRDETLAMLVADHQNAVASQTLFSISSDLTQPNSAREVAEFCRTHGLFPTALVNTARSIETLKAEKFGLSSRKQFFDEFTLGVVAAYELAMTLADMKGSALKKIVNIGSQYGVVAPNRGLYENVNQMPPIHYGIVKAALVHLSRELAVRLAPRQIQVNSVSFGGVEGRASSEFQLRYAQLSPSGRMLGEDEVAGPVDFLLSPASSGMTGHNLVVDGGWTAWVARDAIAIIPARGQSKRLPRKNITDFFGKPMIAWTIEAALASKLFDRIVVSTEDAEIAEKARQSGVEVPFLRGSAFDDTAPVSDATLLALGQAEAYWGESYRTVVQLMPNCPLRTGQDIVATMRRFRESGAPFILTCFRYGWMNPWWAHKLNSQGLPKPLFADVLKSRSQDLDALYCPSGAVWIADVEALRRSRDFYGPGHILSPIDWTAAIDIDDDGDLRMARATRIMLEEENG